MTADSAPLRRVLDDLERTGHDEAVSVGDLLDAFQHRSLGVVLTVFGLIAALPVIGGIPGVSILTGTLILLAAGQSLAGGGALWMPQFVRRREIGRAKFETGVDKARGWTGWIDRLLKPRLEVLVAGNAQRWTIMVAATIFAVTFYPLAFVPYGVTVPALGVLALGLGLMACDGLLVLIGYALVAVTGYVLFMWL
jgi:hypothetical protein